jgi:hypothetical protein
MTASPSHHLAVRQRAALAEACFADAVTWVVVRSRDERVD